MPAQSKPLPPPEELWDLFALNPLTGELFWRTDFLRTGCKPNRLAGSICTKGYTRVTLKGRKYYAHRIIRAWVDGKDPGETFVDHADRNPHNNQPWNIRTCTISQNLANVSKRKGYTFDNTKGKYKAKVRCNRKTVFAGYFNTAEEARVAYIKAKRRFFGDFAP
jgi:hypothetical protein